MENTFRLDSQFFVDGFIARKKQKRAVKIQRHQSQPHKLFFLTSHNTTLCYNVNVKYYSTLKSTEVSLGITTNVLPTKKVFYTLLRHIFNIIGVVSC